mmetsp:Transcript_78368/g.226606  ORF Transcript_78368/g.226606 Transcript_78368/m.226606 type:complete len:329 (+) Transcript_78368:149-1135(+)
MVKHFAVLRLWRRWGPNVTGVARLPSPPPPQLGHKGVVATLAVAGPAHNPHRQALDRFDHLLRRLRAYDNQGGPQLRLPDRELPSASAAGGLSREHDSGGVATVLLHDLPREGLYPLQPLPIPADPIARLKPLRHEHDSIEVFGEVAVRKRAAQVLVLVEKRFLGSWRRLPLGDHRPKASVQAPASPRVEGRGLVLRKQPWQALRVHDPEVTVSGAMQKHHQWVGLGARRRPTGREEELVGQAVRRGQAHPDAGQRLGNFWGRVPLGSAAEVGRRRRLLACRRLRTWRRRRNQRIAAAMDRLRAAKPGEEHRQQCKTCGADQHHLLRR